MDIPQNYDASRYERPSVTTDVALVARDEKGREHILLIKRKNPPFQGAWALPGGFLDMKETLVECALREMEEETSVSLDQKDLEFLLVADDPQRDPRTRVISAVYLARGHVNEFSPEAADDAREVAWFPLDRLPPLAFDHSRILSELVKRVKTS